MFSAVMNSRTFIAVELPSATQTATFKCITFTSTDQTQLRARVILPAGVSVAEPLAAAELSASAELPAVVLFSDLGRGVRSWLHLLRFSALGMPVVALEARPCEAPLKDAWRGALTAEELARALINPDDAASSTLKQLIDDAEAQVRTMLAAVELDHRRFDAARTFSRGMTQPSRISRFGQFSIRLSSGRDWSK